MNIKIEPIRDSFDAGKFSCVAKIGNAYIFCNDSFDLIASHVRDIESINDWADGKKSVTQSKLRSRFVALGFVPEARYDAAHGRRYKLCVYPIGNPAARRVTLAASDGLSDTDPEIAKAIF